MGQQGIYVAPCSVKPNRDRTDIVEAACKEQRLWVIEFEVSNIGKGCAVVKASNPKDAENKLKTEGSYNGTSYMYKITRIEEIIPSPCGMLLCEQIVLKGEN